jgi:hypothetical protein
MAAVVYSAMWCSKRGQRPTICSHSDAGQLRMLPFHLAGDFTVGAFHLVGERAGERVEMKQEAAMAHRYDDDFDERG